MFGSAPLLRLTRVSKRWLASDGEFVISVEALDIAPGARIAVLGDSGTGKTTLLNLLCLAMTPSTAGRFEFNSARAGTVNLADLWRRRRHDHLAQLRARYFGYVPQTGCLLPFLSVRENIALPQRLSGRSDPMVIKRLTEQLGIGQHLNRQPQDLSVGQRQRVAIARALSHRPSIVLADEPTAAVQATLAQEIIVLLVERCRELGAALVIATHSPELTNLAGMSYLVPEIIRTARGVRAEFVAAAYDEPVDTAHSQASC